MEATKQGISTEGGVLNVEGITTWLISETEPGSGVYCTDQRKGIYFFYLGDNLLINGDKLGAVRIMNFANSHNRYGIFFR